MGFDYHITSYLDNHHCSFSYISITRDAVGSKENWRLKIDIANDVNPTENRGVYVKRIKLATLKKNTEILRQYIAVVTVVVIFWILTTMAQMSRASAVIPKRTRTTPPVSTEGEDDFLDDFFAKIR